MVRYLSNRWRGDDGGAGFGTRDVRSVSWTNTVKSFIGGFWTPWREAVRIDSAGMRLWEVEWDDCVGYGSPVTPYLFYLTFIYPGRSH